MRFSVWTGFALGAGERAQALRAAIERNLAEAALLAELLRVDDRFELLMDPPLSVVCFRPRVDRDADAHSRALADAIAADGRILIAPAQADGVTWLRASSTTARLRTRSAPSSRSSLSAVSDALLVAAR